MDKKKIEYKSFLFEMKEMNEDKGTFEGYAAVFGNVDEGGDITEKGAFLRSINARKGMFPILFSHLFKDPAIGKAQISEDSYGLFTKGQLFVDRMQKAKDIFLNMKEGISNSMSFMYDVIQGSEGNKDGRIVRYLKELKLYEVSLLNTGFGMNEMAGVTTVKEDALEAREIEHRFKALETTLNELKSKTIDTNFQQKIEQDLNALRQQISELAQKKDTSENGELAKLIQNIQVQTERMKIDLNLTKGSH